MTTPILGMDELAASQAQPELTVNEALRILEALSPLVVADKDLATPPGSPADGDRYIIAAAPTGDWAGHQEKVALYAGTAWLIITPRVGWLAYVTDEDLYYKFVPGSPQGWIPYP